jgi:nicotinamidase-related amidase
MLRAESSVLLIIDVQGTLAELMDGKADLYENLRKMIRGAKVLDIPILWLEQIPDKLGPTRPEIAELLDSMKPIPKTSFSACDCPEFMERFKRLGCTQVLAAGIETHICVYQTARDLLSLGHEVHVLADCAASRFPYNKQIGLDRIKSAGGIITSVEMAFFEMLKAAEGPKFKEIVKIIK